MTRCARAGFLKIVLTFPLIICAPLFAQAQAPAADTQSAASKAQADAYFDYAMAHLNAEEAAQFNGRAQYVNQAIDYYKKAMALAPNDGVIAEELAEFYLRAGDAEKAAQLATDIIKKDPKNANAHRILARMYAAELDPDHGKVDAAALKNAIDHYKEAASLDPKDAESLSSLARLYLLARDNEAAEKAYKAVIALDATDDDALTGLASLYAGRNDFAGAIRLLEPVTGEDGNPETIQFLADLYEQSGDFSKAADTWKRLLPYANGNQVRRKYCEDLLRTNRLDEAITAWTALAAAEPKNVDDYIQLTDLYGQKRDFAKAHEALNIAKTIDNNLTVRMTEAELMDSEGKTTEAIAAVQTMLNESKKATYSDTELVERIGMLRSMASMEKNANRTQDAIAAYRQIADLNPKAAVPVETEVIETLAQGKDFKGARAEADSALKKFPGDQSIALEHASLLAVLGDYDKAIGELNAMPDARKDKKILVAIAEVQEKAKRYKDALATIDTAEPLMTSPQEKLDLAFRRGDMYEHQKDFDQAEKQFRVVLNMDPDNANALNYLGYMLADRDVRLDEAQQLIAKALDLEPDNGAYLDSLGWLYYRQNHLDQAAQKLQQALDHIGTDPTVHDHMAEVYFKQGKFREAAQQWEMSVEEMKAAAPADMDPVELKRISQRLEEARAKIPASAKK